MCVWKRPKTSVVYNILLRRMLYYNLHVFASYYNIYFNKMLYITFLFLLFSIYTYFFLKKLSHKHLKMVPGVR